MTSPLVISALVLLALQLVVCHADMSCQYYDAATKATFNLAPLQHNAVSAWRVLDENDANEANYTYVFNVCGAADPLVPNKKCGDPLPPSAAFQIRNSDSRCHVLNNNYQNMTWSLIDPIDPTRGIVQTYIGGDNCPASPLGGKRAFLVYFFCTEAYVNEPTTRVSEPQTCEYEVNFETIYGCPLECPWKGTKLCAGNGVCGYDNDAGVPRCFCDALHTGADCSLPVVAPETSSSPACDGVCAGLVVLVILLSILLIASCVIFYRVQKLEKMQVKFSAVDPNAVPASGDRNVN